MSYKPFGRDGILGRYFHLVGYGIPPISMRKGNSYENPSRRRIRRARMAAERARAEAGTPDVKGG